MNKKSWVATTGLCVLMATSAAQAHPIPICVEAYEAGTEVSGAVEGVKRAHVTFTQASAQPGAVAAVGAKSLAWQKAGDKAGPYWRASSGLIGNCQQPNPSSVHALSQQPQLRGGVGPEVSARLAPVAVVHAHARQPEVAESVGPEAGVRLAPAAVALMDASADPAMDFVRFDFTGRAHSSSGWAFGGADHPMALAPAHTFSQVLAQQSSAVGATSPLPVQTSNASLSGPSLIPSVADRPGIRNDSVADRNIDENSGPTPATGKDVPTNVGGTGSNAQTTQVPEPETLALLMIGLLGVAVTSRRRRKLAAPG